MRDTYYLTLLLSKTYYLTPLELKVYYLGKTEKWELIGTFEWDSYNDTGPGAVNWTETPGDYGGIGGGVIASGFLNVKIEVISGWWSDGPGDYEGSLGFKTLVEYATVGPGGSLESNQQRFGSQGEASNAWASAQPQELLLGNDKKVVWGFQEGGSTWYQNNTGSLKFKIYGKR